MRVGPVCFGLCLVMASPAAANWDFRWGGTSVGVWTRNDDGTSLALSCDRTRPDLMRVEYTVVPTEDATGEDTVVVFDVAGTTTQVDVVSYSPSNSRLQIMRSELGYSDPDIEGLRDRMIAGSQVVLPAQPGFEATRFSLRGSGAAINRLEEACAQIWEQG